MNRSMNKSIRTKTKEEKENTNKTSKTKGRAGPPEMCNWADATWKVRE
jgi:hypothetical protein